MKNLCLISYLVCLLGSCNQNPNNPHFDEQSTILHPTYKNVTLHDSLQSVITKFMREETCKSRFNDLFIDKINPVKTVITIKSRHYPAPEAGQPLLYTKIEESIFFIYSGPEQYFKSDMSLTDKNEFTKDSCTVNFWTIIDSAGYYQIIKRGLLPFSPLNDTTRKFAIPVSPNN